MKKYLLLVFLIVAFSPLRLVADHDYILKPNDYSIYSVLIDKWYAGAKEKRPVIRKRTGSCAGFDLVRQEVDYLIKRIPHLEQETVIDFKAKNITSYPLGELILQRAGYDLITDRKINELFIFSHGWDSFYKLYPESEGILTFSRVGFNNKKDQALVSICGQWDSYAGSGIYVLFTKKTNGLWVPEYEIKTWNSWTIEEIAEKYAR